ncbi:hypothetical protein B0A52_00746 [Exophiala mesophila]|uniref:Zn(2)-C6 fungal-type domain-containing protein n=1 Tax=Exophiala mesophila TaxID=212818 RepID=A0A438NI39_EXOME|nr:hypothetical protein B0A52_00746 [Exophiala mesophila]
MDASPRPNSPLLPPFTIRDLNGPEVPPAVIQITGGQYNSTIKSEPDARLQYVDNTDGEIITVGSTFELQQRLDEPVDEPRRVVHCFPHRATQRREENLIHIFDIKKSSASLAIWREHEAYTSKALRQLDTSGSTTTSTAPAASPDRSSSATFENVSAESTISASSESKPEPALTSMPPTRPPAASEVDLAFTGLLRTLQSQLVPLANILDATADGFRRAAEKTTEADATAAEDVLTGFKGIFAELGAMGREFLSSLDAEFQRTRDAASSPLPHDPPVPEPSKPDVNPTTAQVQTKVDPAWKRVSFADPKVNKPSMQKSSSAETKTPNAASADSIPRPGAHVVDARAHDDGFNLSQTKKETGSTVNRPYSFLDKVPKAVLTWPPPPPPRVSNKPLSHNNPTFYLNSILDAETTDPDFSVRYPPLMSVRKSKSVGAFHDRTKTDQVGGSAGHTTSALTRYPSIPQFEEQNRAKVASTHNSKASGFWEPLPWNKANMPVPAARASDNASFSRTSLSSGTDTISLPTEEQSEKQKTAPSILPEDKPKPSQPVRKIPGSWPEPHSNDRFAPKPWPSFSYETPLTSYEPAHDFSARVSSPGVESYYRAPIFPRRNQTVSGTNPAARLNGPFDPLASLPTFRPKAQKSQPNLKIDEQKSKTEVSSRLPQRGHTVHHTDRGRAPSAMSPPLAWKPPTLWDGFVQRGLGHAKSFDQSLSSGHWEPFPSGGWGQNATQSSLPGTANQDAAIADKPKASKKACRTCIMSKIKCNGQRPLCNQCSQSGKQCSYLFDPHNGEMAHQEAVREHPLGAPSDSKGESTAPAKTLPVTGRPIFRSWSDRETQQAAKPERPAQPQPFFGYNSPPSPVFTLATSSAARRAEGPMPPRHSPPSAATVIETCVQMLKDMGYGKSDANELARLNVYAGAAAGNVEDAIEMIEEDREAMRHYAEVEDLDDFRSQVEDFSGNGEIRL